MSFNCLSNRPQCISNLFYPPWTLCLPSAVLGPCLYIYYIWDPAYIYYEGGLRTLLCSGGGGFSFFTTTVHENDEEVLGPVIYMSSPCQGGALLSFLTEQVDIRAGGPFSPVV